MTKMASNLYTKLTADERFRLILGASARGDMVEIERLARTCSQRGYTLRDLAYVERVRASRTLTLTWALLWERGYRDFLILGATYSAPSTQHAVGLTPEPALSATAVLVGLYVGWLEFCQLAGLDGNLLLDTWASWVAVDVKATAPRLMDLWAEESLPDDDPWLVTLNEHTDQIISLLRNAWEPLPFSDR